MTIQLFEVGGCVRDDLLGIPSKDVDFVVIAPSFDAMHHHIKDVLGLKVFLVKEEFATIRAGVPKGHPLRSRCKDADFVLARKDGPSTDGRRPDFVEPGTLADDLARRDFTVNALARDSQTGEIIDLFDGLAHLKERKLQFVGHPLRRIEEDGLRVLRALRFTITKGFSLVDHVSIKTDLAARMLSKVSRERIREEVEKMFRHDTLASLALLQEFPSLLPIIFKDGLRLSATLKA